MAVSRIKCLAGIAGASTVRFWVLVPATRALMPSGLSTGGFLVLVLRVRVLSRRRDCKQNGFLVGVPRYEGFHAVSTVNRWVLGSGVRVQILLCHPDCQQVGSWF